MHMLARTIITDKMKIKNLLKTCLVGAASAAIITSCETERPIYYSAYMTAVETTGGEPYSCLFVSDDSITIIPLNQYEFISKLETDDRIIGTFTIPDGEISDPVEVEFTSFTQLPPQDITVTGNIDTVGNNYIDPQTMWHSGGVKGTSRFLTISFAIQASSAGIQHDIYLVDDTSLSNPDADGYYRLKFRHDANNDPFVEVVGGVATFRLPEKYTAPGIKGIKVDFKNFSPGVDSTLTVTF